MKINIFDSQGILRNVGKTQCFLLLQGVNGKFVDAQPKWKIFENVDKLYIGPDETIRGCSMN